MLYIKFDIQEASKYNDFLRLFKHMKDIRNPDFKEETIEFDWENLTTSQIEDALETIDSFDPQKNRYKKCIPDYADRYLNQYLDATSASKSDSRDVMALFNYLEYDFEVHLDKLDRLTDTTAIVKFSTNNYPFGGLDKFIITLKAFDLSATECFDGFSTKKIIWENDYTNTMSVAVD